MKAVGSEGLLEKNRPSRKIIVRNLLEDLGHAAGANGAAKIGRASWRERV